MEGEPFPIVGSALGDAGRARCPLEGSAARGDGGKGSDYAARSFLFKRSCSGTASKEGKVIYCDASQLRRESTDGRSARRFDRHRRADGWAVVAREARY